MKYWNQIPLFRLILPFIAGIISSILLEFPQVNSVVLLIFLILVSTLLFKKYSSRWLFGFFSFVLFFVFGVCLIQSNHYISKDKYFTNFQSSSFEVKLLETVIEKPNSLKAEVDVLKCFIDGKEQKTVGTAIIYFQNDSLSQNLKYGDHILIKSNWELVKGPTNPSQFNYKSYLKNKGIFHQTYLSDEDNRLNAVNNMNSISLHKYMILFQLHTKFVG